jgi:hypothetical protein
MLAVALMAVSAQAGVTVSTTMNWDGGPPKSAQGAVIADGTYLMVLDLDGDGLNGHSYASTAMGPTGWLQDSGDRLLDRGQIGGDNGPGVVKVCGIENGDCPVEFGWLSASGRLSCFAARSASNRLSGTRGRLLDLWDNCGFFMWNSLSRLLRGRFVGDFLRSFQGLRAIGFGAIVGISQDIGFAPVISDHFPAIDATEDRKCGHASIVFCRLLFYAGLAFLLGYFFRQFAPWTFKFSLLPAKGL